MFFRIFFLSLFSLIAFANEPLTKISLTQEEKAFLNAHPTITLGSDSSWSPFIIKDSSNNITGYDKDFLDLVNQYTGANFQLYTDDWKHIIKKAKNKEIDGLSTSAVHDARKEHFNFSKTYVKTQKLLVTSINNNDTIKSIHDLDKKTVAYQQNNLFDKKLIEKLPGAIALPYGSLSDILDALIKGEIDATIGSSTIIYLAKKRELPFIKVVDFIPDSTLDLVFSIRKDYPEALSILNKAIDAILEEEKIRLHAKWFFDTNLNPSHIEFSKEEKQYLQEHPTLRVQNLSTFPPFNFYENGQPLGYSIDYMKLMAKHMGVKIEFITHRSWSEYLDMLKEDKLDVIPHIAKTPQREAYIAFTNFKHIEYTTGFAIAKGSKIKSMKDLKDKTIAVVAKTISHDYLKKYYPDYKLLVVPTTSRAVEVVSLGQAHAAIASLPTMEYYIQKNWHSNVETVNFNDVEFLPKNALAMGVKKENQILKDILEKVNRSIAHNEIMKLKQKWMDVQSNSNDALNVNELEYLQQKKEIKMCVLPNWLPFEQIDEQGNHKGIGNDIMRIVSEYTNTPIVLLPTKKWSESLQNIRDRKCDILPVAMDVPSRRDAMNFTKPYVSEPFVIATRFDELFIKDVQSIGNRKVGIVKSYAFIEVLKSNNPDIQIVEVKNAQEGLQRVQSGELFGYVDIMAAIGYTIQKYAMLDLKIAGKLEHDIKLSVASRSDEPILNSIMQKALDSITDDQFRTIVGRWIEIKVQQEFDYTKLFYVIGFFTVIILLVLYKNRSINIMNKKLEMANAEIQQQQKMVNKYVLILDTNLDGIITNVNEAYCNATGYSKNDLLGNSHAMMKHPSMSDEFFEHLWQTISSNITWQGEIVNYTKDKEVKYFNMYIEPYFKDHVKVGYRSISEDITDKKRIEELSVTDKLTSLYNRMKLDEMLFMKVEEFKRYNIAFSVILLDIDNFKNINDHFGHDVGDTVLTKVAKVLKNGVRITDVVGRWGGEEFLIICESTNASNTFTVAEHLRQSIAQESFDVVNHISISLGVTQFTQEDNLNSLFKRVDKALYQAKNGGKNKTVLL